MFINLEYLLDITGELVVLTISVSELFPCVFSPSSAPSPSSTTPLLELFFIPSASSICSCLPGHSMTYKRVEISLIAKKNKKKWFLTHIFLTCCLLFLLSFIVNFPREFCYTVNAFCLHSFLNPFKQMFMSHHSTETFFRVSK